MQAPLRCLLHAGPPIDWRRMCGPMRGAIIGAILFEGWAADATHTRFHYKAGRAHLGYVAIRGIRSISLTRADNVVRFRVAGKHSDYRIPESALPLSMTVVLDPPRAATGVCGETVLANATCVFGGTGNGRRVVCG